MTEENGGETFRHWRGADSIASVSCVRGGGCCQGFRFGAIKILWPGRRFPAILGFMAITPRIFVSATRGDLKSHRATVAAALKKLETYAEIQDDWPADYLLNWHSH